MSFEKTWRWYGKSDPITLNDIRQTGATGIVTALHHIPNGEVWKAADILEHKATIEKYGLNWSVVESVPVHEDIKKRSGAYKKYISNYKTTLENLGKCGIDTVCYNFMPILDWSRTNIEWEFEDGSKALKFDINYIAIFDLYILERANAKSDYSKKILSDAKLIYENMNSTEVQKLSNTILLGLPGAEESFSLNDFKHSLKEYQNIDKTQLKKNLFQFIKEILPTAESAGIFMAIHPDDPPRDILGLPRVVSNIDDAQEFIDNYNSPHNGFTFCTGSWGAGSFNNLNTMAEKLAHRVNFLHLRNVSVFENGDFYEDNHLEGDTDMYTVMRILLLEQHKREKNNSRNKKMPLRPDHGHQMLYDLKTDKNNPGYSLIGRMKGLAELTGLEFGIENELKTRNK